MSTDLSLKGHNKMLWWSTVQGLNEWVRTVTPCHFKFSNFSSISCHFDSGASSKPHWTAEAKVWVLVWEVVFEVSCRDYAKGSRIFYGPNSHWNECSMRPEQPNRSMSRQIHSSPFFILCESQFWDKRVRTLPVGGASGVLSSGRMKSKRKKTHRPE